MYTELCIPPGTSPNPHPSSISPLRSPLTSYLRIYIYICNTQDFVTANEGDGREFGEDEDAADYYTDEIRVEDLAVELGYDATVAPFDEANLGRLKVRNSLKKTRTHIPNATAAVQSRTRGPWTHATAGLHLFVSFHTTPHHTMPCHTIPHHTTPYHIIPYHTIPYHTIPYRTVPYSTMPRPVIPYHTIPIGTITGDHI